MSHGHSKRIWDDYYSPQLILRQDACAACGKIRYASRRAAESYIKRLDHGNRKRGRTASKMHAYRCPHGDGWHLAHVLSQGVRTGEIQRRTRKLALEA